MKTVSVHNISNNQTK